jgi:hypothetical protein
MSSSLFIFRLIFPGNLPTSFARESINALKSELDKGSLHEILRYLGLALTISTSKKRQGASMDYYFISLPRLNCLGYGLDFDLSPCNSSNYTQAMDIIVQYSNLIVPQSPQVLKTINSSSAQHLDGLFSSGWLYGVSSFYWY